MSCDAAAGLEASCWMNGRPGTAGAGGAGAGSAVAVALSASAAEIAPAAAIIVEANNFPVLCMVFQSVEGTPAPEASRVTGVTAVTRVAFMEPLRERRLMVTAR
jgi:hypothetical protein